VNTSFGELYHASGPNNGYDKLNQLQAFSRGVLSAAGNGSVLNTIASPSHSQSWTLDALGNFSSVTTDGTQVNRTNNQQNQVTAVGTNNLAFDSNGNTTTDDQGHNLIYDAWNRLLQVKNGTNVLATYTYDALGHRIVENSGGSAKDLFYSTAWQVLEERVGTQVRDQYVWSPAYVDAMIERDRDPNANGGPLSERLYVQQDGNWNVTALINTSGSVVERYVEDPFGLPTFLSPSWSGLSSSQVSWNYLHQGYRFDAAVGFFDGRMRIYSPTLGRWLQVDPEGFAAGDTNLYRDEANGPINQRDPSGEIVYLVHGIRDTGITWYKPLADYLKNFWDSFPKEYRHQEVESEDYGGLFRNLLMDTRFGKFIKIRGLLKTTFVATTPILDFPMPAVEQEVKGLVDKIKVSFR
jgi:RHS repeat-associated protein